MLGWLKDFDAEERQALLLVFIAIIISGIMVGLTIPLISLMLNARGLSSSLIGLNTAMLGIATLVTAPLLPGLVRRFSLRGVLLASIALSILCFLSYIVLDVVWVWFVIRFFHGVAHTALFALSEFWVNSLAKDQNRGRLLGLYATLFAAGMAVGPMILLITGTEGALPFLAGASLMALAGLPFLFAGGRTPDFASEDRSHGAWGFVKIAPVALLAALFFGMLETGLFQLMPVYAVKTGNTAAVAAIMISVIGAGNMLLQLPVGWLADRFDRRAVLMLCAFTGAIGAISLPWLIATPWALYPSLLIWAGLLFGLYTVGLSMLGDIFQGAALMRANAAYVMLYSLGTLGGPIMLGGAMDIWGPNGFPAAVALICGGYGLFALLKRGDGPPQGDQGRAG